LHARLERLGLDFETLMKHTGEDGA